MSRRRWPRQRLSKVIGPTVFHSPRTAPELSALPDVGLRAADDLFATPGTPRRTRDGAVLLVDATMLGRARDVAALPPHVIVVTADAESDAALRERADLSLVHLADAEARRRVLRSACRFAEARATAERYRRLLLCARRD